MSRWSFADWFFSRQCRRRGKSRHVQHAPPAARRYRKPQIQQLELRTLLTTFLVDRSDDVSATAAQVCTAAPNDCTLRGAIIAANQNQGADTITFDPTLAGVPITLSLPNAGGDENLAKAGDLDVLDDLTIQGQSAANTIIQGGTNASNGIDKVFSINPNRDHAVNFTLFGVTVQFGRNTQPVTPAPNFSYTGAGLDWCGFECWRYPSVPNFRLNLLRQKSRYRLICGPRASRRRWKGNGGIACLNAAASNGNFRFSTH